METFFLFKFKSAVTDRKCLFPHGLKTFNFVIYHQTTVYSRMVLEYRAQSCKSFFGCVAHSLSGRGSIARQDFPESRCPPFTILSATLKLFGSQVTKHGERCLLVVVSHERVASEIATTTDGQSEVTKQQVTYSRGS